MSEIVNNEQELLNKAVEDGGSYSLIKRRLESQGSDLQNKVNNLNQKRISEFGGSKNEIIGKINLRTNHNCTPIDMAQVGGLLLLGYDVFLGIKKDVSISDLFSIYKFSSDNNDFKVDEIDINRSFLDNKEFKQSVAELFRYYKEAKLIKVSKDSNYLYITFKMGRSIKDIKVYRFTINDDGTILYKDDKGKENLIEPNSHDFKWELCTRENHVSGKFPHINILDTIFVETIGGDLTIKIENNTSNGDGIYSEPVNDPKQSLEDAKISYSLVGNLILLKILPYREENTRYFVYNKLTETIFRVDSIEKSCISLPEGHGIVFPNGYALENGEYKIFEKESENLKYMQTIASPNGEDYMFIFFDEMSGFYTVYSYNIIQKKLETPIHAHGYSLYNDGKFIIFRSSENQEPTKVHPMRIWQTPFMTSEFFRNKENSKVSSYMSNIGNAELVRGISDLFDVINFIAKKEVTSALYENLIKTIQKIADNYHWLSDNEVDNILDVINQINKTSELIIDEFEKVKTIQKQATEVLNNAIKLQKEIISESKTLSFSEIAPNVNILDRIKKQLGLIISIKEQRYINIEKVEELESEINLTKKDVNENLLVVLQQEKAFSYYLDEIEKVEKSLSLVDKVVDIIPLEENINKIQDEIDLINDEINGIEAEDATVVTKILDTVSEVFAKLNQIKSRVKNKKKEYLSTEAKSEFASQFKLLSQSVAASISKSSTPDICDAELSRLMNQVESLESKFSQFDDFLTEIMNKRDEIQDVFENHKIQLINEIQKRVVNIEKAAKISINSISKKVEKFNDINDLNAFFASDSMVLKIYQFVKNIRDLNDVVKADDIESKLKKIKDQSLRSLRDNKDIFEDGGKIMKMGKHKFTVNKNDVDLTILPIDGKLTAHLTGTDFYEVISNDELYKLKEYWELDLPSETNLIYRGEFLAYSILSDAELNIEDLSIKKLMEANNNETLNLIVSKYAATRYKEGYIKGVHDFDATKILEKVLKVYDKAGLLKLNQNLRSYAIILEGSNLVEPITSKNKEFKNAKNLAEILGNMSEIKALNDKKAKELIEKNINNNGYSFEFNDLEAYEMANYINELKLENINNSKCEIGITSDAYGLCNMFKDFLIKNNFDLNKDVTIKNFLMVKEWMKSFVEKEGKIDSKLFIEEAVMIFLLDSDANIKLNEQGLKLTCQIDGLLGDHSNIDSGKLTLTLDDFISRGNFQKSVVVPSYERYTELRKEISLSQKEMLQLDGFKAKPLSSFVRNKLITNSYLHLIGDNLAKQIGTAGDSKRTDLMGMLLLISPPGYGKTTIIEYVANKLGLVFMKINCPSLNHSIVSLDPAEATDATSRKELEKLNLALEMGNNVMLYLDDIQHTNPEFLQKFISLCDGTRKIDGVWKGKPKTYDFKGKKFAVVMAGNPYTETGDAFKIPDMLANRADIYNLGDQLSGQEGIFELSYIENSLTSNKVLSPLANRDMEDLYKFVEMAKGKNIPLTEFDYNYSSAEANEIVSVIKKMITIQEVVLKVNQQYIISASVESKYRDMPPFRLQGSYRNMNKMVEKIIPVMNDDEVISIILDHYKGESQTLTVGSEDNYLRLKQLLNMMTEDEQKRWDDIMKDFNKNKSVGDEGTDGFTRIANQINNLGLLMSNSDSFTLDDYVEKTLEIINSKEKSFDNKKFLSIILKALKTLKPNEEKEALAIELLEKLNNNLDKKKKTSIIS